MTHPLSRPWLANYGDIPPTLSYPGCSMYELVRRAAEMHPDTKAWEFEGNRVSYRQFITRIDAAARALYALGLRSGDRVMLALPNCPQAAELFYAADRIGAVTNMVHPLSSVGEFRRYAALSGSRFAVTLESFAPSLCAACPEIPVVTTRISDALPVFLRPVCRITQEAKYRRKAKTLPVIGWKHFLRGGKGVTLPPLRTSGDAPAVILYSGGTTGITKAILHSANAFNAAGLQTMAANHFNHPDGHRMIAVLPNFHGFGLGIGFHAAFIHGCTVMLLPRFSVPALMRLLRRRPSYITGVPTMFEALLRAPAPRQLNLSSLRGVYSGGDSLPPDLKDRFDAFLASHGATVSLREGYGATECVAACCLSPETGARPSSIGIPFPDMRIRVCAPETETPLPPGEDGELCIAGPTVMLGYLNDPEETALTLRRDSDGTLWLHTGDIGCMDADGYFYFKGRLKRMIVTSGYNVYPRELEHTLAAHPKIAAVCTVGVPDPYRIQRIRACIVPIDGIIPDAELEAEIAAYAAENIARYALPREYVFLRELPRTKLGKIDYRQLEA